MNPPRSQPPRDDEIDALLARRYRDTSPEFEARWVALKREIRTAPPARHLSWFHGWMRWSAKWRSSPGNSRLSSNIRVGGRRSGWDR